MGRRWGARAAAHRTHHVALLAPLLVSFLAPLGCVENPDPFEPTVSEIAPGVFSRQIQYRSANQTFVVFEDYVVVFDPGEVVEVPGLLEAIRARSDKPIRYAVVSHFHPDHAAGASVLEDEGAEVIAGVHGRQDQEGWARAVFEQRVAGRMEGYAGLQFPSITYMDLPKIFDDGSQRMEIRHYGHGHTTGDLVAWLPKHGILLTADVSNNGPLNLDNSDIASWIGVLDQLAGLPVRIVVPGHGERGERGLLEMNRRFLAELLRLVGNMVEGGRSFEEVLAEIEIPFHEEWIGDAVRDTPGNVKRAFLEVGGTLEEDE